MKLESNLASRNHFSIALEGKYSLVDSMDVSSQDCHSDTYAVFKHQNYGHWYDPGNWRGGPREDPAVIPHLQRVPCRYDTAIFPPQSAFKVAISDQPVDISRLQMNDEYLTSGKPQYLSTLQPPKLPRIFLQLDFAPSTLAAMASAKKSERCS